MEADTSHITKPESNDNEVERARPTSARRGLSPTSFRLRFPRNNPDDYDENFEPAHDDESVASISNEEDATTKLKRPADDGALHIPFKRQKGLLNGDYLGLLNSEIQDAAQRVSAEDITDLPPSQLGLTFWSGTEKNVFFESIARLGRDDLEGIAERIGSKSAIEVKHYLHILQDAKDERLEIGSRPILTKSEYPAAVELSQPCVHALDEAADTVSLRQERREQQREEGIWGGVWDLTPDVAKRIQGGTQNAEDIQDLHSVEFFNLPNWLELSKNVFMNSCIPASSWSHVDNVPPSIWATTFEDFRSLAVSITRRLVQAAIFSASTRIRSHREHRPFIRDIVRRKDIEAAVASLNMSPNAKEFWRGSARRLRLDVYDDDNDGTGEPELLSYDEVEGALVFEELDTQPAKVEDFEENMLSATDDSSLEDSAIDDMTDASDDEEEAIDNEANEVFRFSLADFPETHRMKQALQSRIATERQQEQYAEECDQYASYKEELEMWDLLQKPAPMQLPKIAEPRPAQRSKHEVEGMYSIGSDWRGNTKYLGEWETMPREDEDD